jgi:hypothetical protein
MYYQLSDLSSMLRWRLWFGLCGMLWVLLASPSAMAGFADNFNDNTLNTRLWTANVPSTGSVTVTGGVLRLELTSATSGSTFAAGVNSNCHQFGDFDASFDYNLVTWPANNGIRLGLMSGCGPVERVSDSNFGGEVYLTHFTVKARKAQAFRLGI